MCLLSLKFLLFLRMCLVIFPNFYKPWVCLDCVTNSSPTLLCDRPPKQIFSIFKISCQSRFCARRTETYISLSKRFLEKYPWRFFFILSSSKWRKVNERVTKIYHLKSPGPEKELFTSKNWLCNFFRLQVSFQLWTDENFLQRRKPTLNKTAKHKTQKSRLKILK